MGRIDHVIGLEVCSTLPAEFASTLGSAATDAAGGLGLHHDLGDGFGASWESAWIDLGGEG